eukprot:TRINITY_DN14746_c0_g1_i1.p1 TRINITY_DN14746_c0_g1~~TRINITY_DN14746_c0_g1_i1.p1  ORF type:complete len:379 (+),score=92.73 TRINITY_DN14746_c0_g1_i1:203-1339(+)
MSFSMKKIAQFDAYPKTSEDFRIRTVGGAAVSIAAMIIISLLIISEFALYLSPGVRNELEVDKSLGQKLKINFDIEMHKLPCAALSLDVMDVSGSHELDVAHNIFKERLTADGKKLKKGSPKQQKKLGKPNVTIAETRPGCATCYGAEPTADACCDTCQSVRDAYRKKGWSLRDLESIAQCVRDGVVDELDDQKGEGCRVYGYVHVSKVAGNFHVAPGKSFENSRVHVHDLATHGGESFDLTHTINELSFGEKYPGLINPLDGAHKKTKNVDMKGYGMMYQYFVKVVPTVYTYSDGNSVETNQFAVTEHERFLDPHATSGLPGVFFMYEISPIKVTFSEAVHSFASFLTSICAIVGGVFTVSGMVDSLIYKMNNRKKN